MGKLLNKSATCSDASSADSSTVAWKDALISGRCPVELYFQPPASACGISPPGPGRSLFLFSSIWSWEGGLWYWLDWVLNPAPATYAACQQGTSFSGFRFLLYEMGNAVSCGGMWNSYEMGSVNRTQKWQILQGWEKPTPPLFLHLPTQAPATHDLLSQFFLLYCILKNCNTFFLVKGFNVDFRYLIPGQKIPIQHPKCLLLVARCWETQKIVKTWFQPWGRRKLVLISTVVSTQVREKLPKEYEDRITL